MKKEDSSGNGNWNLEMKKEDSSGNGNWNLEMKKEDSSGSGSGNGNWNLEMKKEDSSGSGKEENGNTTDSDSVDIILRKVFRGFLEQERKENPEFFASLDKMKDSEILESLRRKNAEREATSGEDACSSNNADDHNSQDQPHVELPKPSKERSKKRKNLK